MSDAVKPLKLLSRVAAIALLLAAAACSSVPENRQVSLPEAPKDKMQPAVEREHQRILSAYGGAYDDPRLHAMITKVVNRLVAASERPDLKYDVTILNSPAINAFALPNGQLYVSRGLVALANDQAELASVLSHEMAHVIARHAALREDQARQAAVISTVVSEVLSDPQVGALALAKSKLALASFSRAQEFEADGIGVGITARAGYDPYGATRFLTAMQRNADLRMAPQANDDPHTIEFLSSHPATPERVSNAQNNARQYTAPGGGERDTTEYLSTIDGMVYGEDPGEGYVRGRRFLHAKLGFTFVAPPEFALDNTAQAVLGVRDGGSQAMRLDVVSVPSEQTLADFLRSGWIENVDPSSVESFTVNGLPAASASATGKDWSFRLYAVRFGSEVYRFVFAAKQLSPELSRSFRESVSSFRRMTLKERQQAKPLRIKIVTAHAGDTVERLAARMAIADHQRERFRILNGLGPRDQVKPGDRLKLVVE